MIHGQTSIEWREQTEKLERHKMAKPCTYCKHNKTDHSHGKNPYCEWLECDCGGYEYDI